MDLINKKHIPRIQIGEQGRQVPRFLNGRAGSNADIDMQFIGNNSRQGSLSQARRAIKQYMVEGFFAEFGRFYKNRKVFLYFFLSDILR